MTKLLQNLDFSSKLNATDAVTESGKEMLKNYRAYLFVNPSNFSLVNNFVREAQQFSYDKGMMSILESVLSFVDQNKISWKLATACESISNNNSKYNTIAKLGVSQVEKLLEMDETNVVSYIKAGALRDIQYIPEFRNICKEAFGTTKQIQENVTSSYVSSSPVSYVEINENGAQVFAVLGNTYQIYEGKVEKLDSYDSDVFNRINEHLKAMEVVGDDIKFTYKKPLGDSWSFTLNESSITISHKTITESFSNANAFMEYCDTVSRIMSLNEKRNFNAIATAISDVFENIDNICSLDTVKMFKNTNGTRGAIIEAKENVALVVEGRGDGEYTMIAEALTDVQKYMGITVNTEYQDRINEDLKKNDVNQYNALQEELRYKKIEELSEALKGNPAAMQILTQITKDLRTI